MPPLNWLQFSRDLIVAAHFSRVVGVYSLEGCIQQGFLARLRTLDWTAPVAVPIASVEHATAFRHRVARVLWIAAHLPYLGIAGLIAIAALIVGLGKWRRQRRRRAESGSSNRL
jgi:hypothetical protein